MKNKNTKHGLLLALIAFFTFVGFSHSQSAIEFDLENLRNQDPDLTRAYDIVKIQDAWEEIKDSNESLNSVVVGVVDSGIDPNHQEFNFPEVNFGLLKRSILFDFSESGHGTKVSGIIGANNVSATAFLTPDSPQMNGILSGALGEDQYVLEIRPGPGTLINIFAALESAIESESQVINMSFGGTTCINTFHTECFTSNEEFLEARADFEKIFQSATSTLFVAAAGNDGINALLDLPASLSSLSNVITVGATDLKDNRAVFNEFQASNFGLRVNLSAPGLGVYAPRPDNNYDANFSGTSASAPFVTSTAGLLKAINPNLTPAEIKQILIDTGDEIDTDKPIGPRLNAFNAVCHEDVLNCTPQQTIFEDSFETYNLGNLNGQGGWIANTGSTSWQVVDTGCIDGNQCARARGGMSEGARKFGNPIKTGHIEFWTKVLNNQVFKFSVAEGSVNNCNIRFDTRTDEIIANTHPGDVIVPGGEILIRDHWYRIAIEWDKSMESCRFKLDNNAWTPFLAVNPSNPFASLDTVRIGASTPVAPQPNDIVILDFISLDSSDPSPL